MEQRVRDICVTALSHLCVKQLEVCRVSPLLHVHSHSALPRVFLQRGKPWFSLQILITARPALLHIRQTLPAGTQHKQPWLSLRFSLHHRPHTGLWLSSYHSLCFLRLHVSTAFKCHLHASTCRHRTWIHHIHTLLWWIRLCAFSLLNENKHKRCSFALLC